MTSFLASQPILFAAAFFGLVGSVLLLRSRDYLAQTRIRNVPTAWLAAAVIQAAATFGHSLRGDLPPWVVFSAVNGLQILSVSLLWHGTRSMAGRSLPGWVAGLPLVIWLAACAVPGFMETARLRLSLYLPLAYGVAFWATFDLLGIYRRHNVRAAFDMAVLLGIVTLTLLVVVLQTLGAPRFTVGPQYLFTGIPALVTALYGTTLPFLMLAVTREWDALEEAARHAAWLQAGRAQVERLHGGLPAVIFLREMAPDGSSRNVYRAGDFEAVLGWPATEIAGRDDYTDLMHPDDANLRQWGPRLLRDGHAIQEWRMRQPDGNWRQMQTSALVLTRRPDGGAEIVGYTVDISARRAAEARALASARLASLGEMAAGMAHELKQPLQAISISAEMAMMAVRQGDADAIEARLERIVGQTQRTARLIDHLRRFARGVEDGAPPEAIPVNVPVEAALELSRSALKEALVDIELALGDPAPVVRGHAVLLEQVLTNLLLNARDALQSRPAEAPRRIRITSAAGQGGTVSLTLADTGGGIAPEMMARLFEPFATTKGPDKGTGLGLSICHGLIKGMGGGIVAHNDADGAVFTITLPSAVADDEHADRTREITEGS